MTSQCNKVDAVRHYASYRLNLLLLKGEEVRDYVLSLKMSYGENKKYLFCEALDFSCIIKNFFFDILAQYNTKD